MNTTLSTITRIRSSSFDPLGKAGDCNTHAGICRPTLVLATCQKCRFGPAPVCKHLSEVRRLFSAELEAVVNMTKTGAALSHGWCGWRRLSGVQVHTLAQSIIRENNDKLVARKFLKELTWSSWGSYARPSHRKASSYHFLGCAGK